MKVLVPLDGSEMAEAAVAEARRLVESHDGQIILLTVGEVAETSEHRHEEHGALRRIVDPVAKRLSDLHVTVRTDMGGDAVNAIVRAAAEEDVDQIVMSTHGRSGLSRFTHGSVADGVVRRSPVPVTLIRPGGPHLDAQRALLDTADCGDFVAAAISLHRGGAGLSGEHLRRLRSCLDELPERDQLPAAEAYLAELPVADRGQAAVDFIEHGSAARREAALDATRYLNQELISALAAVAATDDYERRWAAYQAIKRIGGEAAINPLVEALRSDDLSVRWIASDGLTTIGQPAAIEVLRALSTTEPTINFHRAARRVLRHLELPDHEPALQRLLASLEQATALTLAPALAQELLRELEREFPAW